MTGKTTTVGNLGIELEKPGKKVFAVDADAQGKTGCKPRLYGAKQAGNLIKKGDSGVPVSVETGISAGKRNIPEKTKYPVAS